MGSGSFDSSFWALVTSLYMLCTPGFELRVWDLVMGSGFRTLVMVSRFGDFSYGYRLWDFSYWLRVWDFSYELRI